MKTILICDDHSLFTDGLVQLLAQAGKNYIVESVNDTAACEAKILRNKYDIFICDLNIDKQDGFELLAKMSTHLSGTRKIILSAYCETFLVKKAQAEGIHAYLKKDSVLEELIKAIESAEPFYTNASDQVEDNDYLTADNTFKLKFKLSKQEKKIIKLVVKGKTSKEIAEELFISKVTVDTHRRNINRKLEISNVSSLYKFAYENQLLD